MKKVLLVDDDIEVRESIANSLSDQFVVLEASNGAEARDILLDFQVDVIVTDIYMPKVDGFGTGVDLIEYLLKLALHIPIIVITGYRDIAEKYQDVGCIKVLKKPLDMRELIPTIDSFVVDMSKCKACSTACDLCNVTKGIRIANSKVNDLLKMLEEMDNAK